MFQDICVPDFIIKPNDLDYLKKHDQIHGVYILFAKREPMYVGKSQNIHYRVRNHLLGNSSNTNQFANCIDEIGLHFTENIDKADFLEMAYITEYNPPMNVHRTKWILSSHIKYKKYNSSCKAKSSRNPDNPCRNQAHVNGYCAWHGGNGITIKSKADEEAENIIKNNIQLKLII